MMTSPSWNPDQYLRFSDERTRPCRELAAAVSLSAPRRITDLGCGPGNSTAALIARWPDATVVGLDSSEAMIATARKAAPHLTFAVGDIAGWRAIEEQDIVFSNAALQWVPDHEALYPHLFAQVARGGALAVQVPFNPDAEAHRAMRDVAAMARFRDRFVAPVRTWHVHPREFYYDILAPTASRVDLWATEYMHVVQDAAAIVEWYRGTGLRPYLDRLDDAAERDAFLREYLARVEQAYAPRPDGRILFPFRRLFLVAYR